MEKATYVAFFYCSCSEFDYSTLLCYPSCEVMDMVNIDKQIAEFEKTVKPLATNEEKDPIVLLEKLMQLKMYDIKDVKEFDEDASTVLRNKYLQDSNGIISLYKDENNKIYGMHKIERGKNIGEYKKYIFPDVSSDQLVKIDQMIEFEEECNDRSIYDIKVILLAVFLPIFGLYFTLINVEYWYVILPATLIVELGIIGAIKRKNHKAVQVAINNQSRRYGKKL